MKKYYQMLFGVKSDHFAITRKSLFDLGVSVKEIGMVGCTSFTVNDISFECYFEYHFDSEASLIKFRMTYL